MEEDFKIKEEILFSNPSLRPIQEIVEIEFKNIGRQGKKTEYQDSVQDEDDYNFKEMNIIIYLIILYLSYESTKLKCYQITVL